MKMAAVVFLVIWTAMAQTIRGQEIILPRPYDNLQSSEIRLDSRAIRWMDFNKPERQPQQVRPQPQIVTVLRSHDIPSTTI